MLVLSYKTGTGSVPQWTVCGAGTKQTVLSPNIEEPWGLWINPTGTKLHIVGEIPGVTLVGGNHAIFEYNIGTPWDLTTATYNTRYQREGAGWTQYSGLTFSPDGLKYHIQYNNNIYTYSLNTAYELSSRVSATPVVTPFTTTGTVSGSNIIFSTDGTKLFTYDSIRAYEFNLGTPYDVTTISAQVNSAAFAVNAVLSIFFNPSGSHLYYIRDTDLYSMPLNANFSLAGTPSSSVVVTNLMDGNQDAKSSFIKDDGTLFTSQWYAFEINKHQLTFC